MRHQAAIYFIAFIHLYEFSVFNVFIVFHLTIFNQQRVTFSCKMTGSMSLIDILDDEGGRAQPLSTCWASFAYRVFFAPHLCRLRWQGQISKRTSYPAYMKIVIKRKRKYYDRSRSLSSNLLNASCYVWQTIWYQIRRRATRRLICYQIVWKSEHLQS